MPAKDGHCIEQGHEPKPMLLARAAGLSTLPPSIKMCTMGKIHDKVDPRITQCSQPAAGRGSRMYKSWFPIVHNSCRQEEAALSYVPLSHLLLVGSTGKSNVEHPFSTGIMMVESHDVFLHSLWS